jgi:acyl-coenzyme A thioesterase PaaI-like protein
MKLENNNKCFVCGKDNEWGFKLDFTQSDNKLFADVVFDSRFQGFKDIIHGGIVGTILDEVMVNMALRLGYNAVTAEIKIRLKKPTKAGIKYHFVGEIVEVKKRTISTKAYSLDPDKNIVAESEAILMRI